MRRAAVAVTFAEIYDAPTEGEWDGRDGDISDLVRYHEVPAGSHKLFEDKGSPRTLLHAFSRCIVAAHGNRHSSINGSKAIDTQSDGHTMKCG